MKFFNKNNDVDYTRPFDEYIREYDFENGSNKNKIRISRNTIKRIITSLVLVPTTLAVGNVQKVNEKESKYEDEIRIVDDISNEKPKTSNIDMSKVFQASDGSYWVSEEDYNLIINQYEEEVELYEAPDNLYWDLEEDYFLVNGQQKSLK